MRTRQLRIIFGGGRRRTPGGANGVTGRVCTGRAYYNYYLCCTADPALAHVTVVIVVLIVIIVTVVVINGVMQCLHFMDLISSCHQIFQN